MFDWITNDTPLRAAAIAGAALWTLVCYRAGIWTQHRSQFREITETLAHGVVFGVLLYVALGGLPKQNSCSDENDQARKSDAGADDRGLVGVSMDLPAWEESRPERVVYPLAEAHQYSTKTDQNQSFPQLWVVSQGQSANDQSYRQCRGSAIPLVSRDPLQFVHAESSPIALAQHSAKAGA